MMVRTGAAIGTIPSRSSGLRGESSHSQTPEPMIGVLVRVLTPAPVGPHCAAVHTDHSAASRPQLAGPAPGPPDWPARYEQGDTPWDRHSTTHALERVIRDWGIQPCRVLDMGCGTGKEAVDLARMGFAVTAFDLVPRAIELSRERARDAALDIDFRVADFRVATDLGGPFPFVFDSGLYHSVRRGFLRELLGFLDRVTQPGSLWLTVVGNANDTHPPDHGPPRLHAAELCAELDPFGAFVELRETHFQPTSPADSWHPLAWSVLLRRR